MGLKKNVNAQKRVPEGRGEVEEGKGGQTVVHKGRNVDYWTAAAAAASADSHHCYWGFVSIILLFERHSSGHTVWESPAHLRLCFLCSCVHPGNDKEENKMVVDHCLSLSEDKRGTRMSNHGQTGWGFRLAVTDLSDMNKTWNVIRKQLSTSGHWATLSSPTKVFDFR